MGPGIYSHLFFASRRCFGISNDYNQFTFIRAIPLSVQRLPPLYVLVKSYSKHITSSPPVTAEIQHSSSTFKDQSKRDCRSDPLRCITLCVTQRLSEQFTDHLSIGHLCLIFNKHLLRAFPLEAFTSQSKPGRFIGLLSE